MAELILDLPDIPLTREDQEKRFQDIIKINLHDPEHAQNESKFREKFLKEHLQFQKPTENKESEFLNSFFNTGFEFLKAVYYRFF